MSPPNGKQNDNRVTAQRAEVLIAGWFKEKRAPSSRLACLTSQEVSRRNLPGRLGILCATSSWIVVTRSTKRCVCAQALNLLFVIARTDFGGFEQRGAGGSHISVLLCVSIDEQVLQSVAVDSDGLMRRLVQNIVQQLRSTEYEGICLLLPATFTEGKRLFL
ncbi:hypothetical protein MRX96_036231 [Rhipicephalus microplus]